MYEDDADEKRGVLESLFEKHEENRLERKSRTESGDEPKVLLKSASWQLIPTAK